MTTNVSATKVIRKNSNRFSKTGKNINCYINAVLNHIKNISPGGEIQKILKNFRSF